MSLPQTLTEPVLDYQTQAAVRVRSDVVKSHVMRPQTRLETDSKKGFRCKSQTVSLMLVTALVLGASTLAGRFWLSGTPWFAEFTLNLLQGLSLVLIAVALLLRKSQRSRRQKIADSRERQLQAMLSMFRVVKHELNNDMQVVAGNAELASMMLGEGSKIANPVGNISAAASLAIDRIQQLTVFSSSENSRLSAIDLNALMRETVARLTNEMPAIVMFRLELDPLPNRVMADRALLSLSLSYLIRLAGKSLFHGGEIVVRTVNLNGAAHTGQTIVSSEIFLVRGLAGSGGEPGTASRDCDRRARFARVLEQAQNTTKALVERSGATVLKGSYSMGNESLIKMGFEATGRHVPANEYILEDSAPSS